MKRRLGSVTDRQKQSTRNANVKRVSAERNSNGINERMKCQVQPKQNRAKQKIKKILVETRKNIEHEVKDLSFIKKLILQCFMQFTLLNRVNTLENVLNARKIKKNDQKIFYKLGAALDMTILNSFEAVIEVLVNICSFLFFCRNA